MPKKSAKVYDLTGKNVSKIELPSIFSTPIRPDVIKRAVLAIQSTRYQRQGRDPMAGKKTTAESRGTGGGNARIPRQKTQSGKAAFAPGTVHGRAGHPPTSEKSIVKRIPKKEKRLALFSAIAATASKEVVTKRGHSAEDVLDIPLIVIDELERLKKTKEVEDTLTHLGLLSDLYRVKESRHVRAGKGKTRGRRIKHAIGPIIIINENQGVAEAAQNIPGVNVVTVSNLNAEHLAPGTHPGRLTVWTNGAISKLGQLYSGGTEE